MRAASALFVSKLSLPPRRIAALPLFRHRTAQSTVTLGRASKMTPMTPIGTLTLRSLRPFGRVVSSSTSPSGSGSAATWRMESARWARRSPVSVRRSTWAAVRPFACAASRSRLLAAARVSRDRSILAARSISAALRAAAGETASASEAARARTAMSVTSLCRSSGMGVRDFRLQAGLRQRNFGGPREGLSRRSFPC